MHRRVLARIAREPRLFGREAQHRREPRGGAAEHLIDHGERGLAGLRRIRIAVERVLADVEVERREVVRHERRQRGEDALVVERRVGLAHHRVEFGEPVQHQPLQLRHVGDRDAILGAEVHEVAEHPADGVAQLAVGIDRGLDDLGADADIVGVVRRAHPHAQDVGAGLLHHVLRRDRVAERLRHLAPVLVEHEAVRQHHVERRDAARAAAFQQRGMKPAAMLVRAFQIHHGVRRRRPSCA